MSGVFAIGITKRPKFPEFSRLNDRIDSFENSKNFVVFKTKLAEAGFYFSTNNPDYVTCYSCGGKLRKPVEENYPFIEHAKNFPYCTYLLCMQGKEFVCSVYSSKEVKTSQETI